MTQKVLESTMMMVGLFALAYSIRWMQNNELAAKIVEWLFVS